MKSQFLLPLWYKKIGWVLLALGVFLGVPTLATEWSPSFLDVKVISLFIDGFPQFEQFVRLERNNILNEILGVFMVVGGLFVAFSEEFDEDELISKLRLDCLVWAIYWNYGILIVSILLVFGLSFFWVMVFNMFTPLAFFIVRFNWLLHKLRKSTENEE